MLCKKPFYKDNIPYGCGQCLPCRVNKRRLWTHRIMLEEKLHKNNCFLTLTYSDDKIPLHICDDNVVRGNLNPDHVKNFIKRLRKKVDPIKLRYVAVGEYGDQTNRPHYHIALFGYPNCAFGIPRVTTRNPCKCPQCTEVRETWKDTQDNMSYGHTYNGQLNKDSAQYVAGYVTKKLTNPKDKKTAEFLKGRHPEFARMSNRPGIAAPAMEELAKALKGKYGYLAMQEGDVPNILKTDGKIMPLGRYLKEKIREKLGNEKETPKEILHKLRNENIIEAFTLWEEAGKPQNTTQEKLQKEKNIQKVRNLETRQKLFKNVRSI
jgi:hypothetical protein